MSCVAGMVQKKHHVDLIEAMMRVRSEAQLILVGHGPLLDEMRVVCQQRLPRTILIGFKNQTELPVSFAMADAFVLPSLWEEFGLGVNEAMCFGLPIITSGTFASSRDLVSPGENGFTFLSGNADALAVRLSTLLEDAELRHRFGQCSRDIIADWNYDRAVQGILAALEFTRGHIRA